MTWAITALSILGVVLNIHRRRECFIIWTFTNGAWMVYDWSIGATAQAVLFGVYLVLAVWGLWKWRKDGVQ